MYLNSSSTNSHYFPFFSFTDFRNESSVAVEDVLLYCTDLAFEGDDIEAALALRQTIEKRKVPWKELQRALMKADTTHTGYINQKTFDKLFMRLCGGDSFVKVDQLSDIKRFVDPLRDGKMDMNIIVAMAIVCGDVSRAENKLKNLLKTMRVKGIDYRAIIMEDAGTYCTLLVSFIIFTLFFIILYFCYYCYCYYYHYYYYCCYYSYYHYYYYCCYYSYYH